MDIKLNKAKPVEPVVESVTITMTPKQAKALRTLVGKTNTKRLCDAVYQTYHPSDELRAAIDDVTWALYFTLQPYFECFDLEHK